MLPTATKPLFWNEKMTTWFLSNWVLSHKTTFRLGKNLCRGGGIFRGGGKFFLPLDGGMGELDFFQLWKGGPRVSIPYPTQAHSPPYPSPARPLAQPEWGWVPFGPKPTQQSLCPADVRFNYGFIPNIGVMQYRRYKCILKKYKTNLYSENFMLQE